MLWFLTLLLLVFDVGNVFVTVFSIIVAVVILVTFKLAHGNVLSLGFVFIVYNLLMHFGFGIVNFIISDAIPKELYATWTLAFLRSENYALAIIISSLAFETFTIAWLLGLKKRKFNGQLTVESNNVITREKTAFYFAGIMMLVVVFAYFVFLMAKGQLTLDMTYTDYREYVMKGNNIYSWIIVLYPTGLLYVIAASEGRKRSIGVALFTLTAIILLITGNKGEVFYAVLASLGILGYQGKKLDKKHVILLCVIMFIIIPVVTSTRSTTGVRDGFSLEFASFTEAFLEIGMQIRCLVYSLDGVQDGIYDFMYGYSYLKPLCGVLSYVIFPLGYLPEIPIDLSTSKSDFSGYGFTQVAEGYLNFGILGAVLLFAVLGYFIGKLEFSKIKISTLCFVGSVLAIFINMSRNTFIFVPGQVLVMFAIYFAGKIASKIEIRSRW